MGLADDYDWQAVACAQLGSSFYEALLVRMAEELRRGGRLAEVWEPTAMQTSDLHALRVLGGVHRLVLDGGAPDLAVHYPSTGGDGDAAACWPAFHALLCDPPPSVVESLERPPQTNEVTRSAALASGVAVVADERGLPIRLLEVGASAGLNLRLENHWYETGDRRFGDPSSPIRFVDVWDGGEPPLSPSIQIKDRRGCDLSPIDAASDDGRQRLLSYVWPDQSERFTRLRDALDLADRIDAPVDRASADEWLAEHLRNEDGVATVVQHSICWLYLPEEVQERISAMFEERGASATERSPIGWLRLELSGAEAAADLRLTTWPGGEERVLATTSAHPRRIEWLE